ncbi:MAG: hypothetical protein OHK0012_19990 [Synechococcales cyanobacterium]
MVSSEAAIMGDPQTTTVFSRTLIKVGLPPLLSAIMLFAPPAQALFQSNPTQVTLVDVIACLSVFQNPGTTLSREDVAAAVSAILEQPIAAISFNVIPSVSTCNFIAPTTAGLELADIVALLVIFQNPGVTLTPTQLVAGINAILNTSLTPADVLRLPGTPTPSPTPTPTPTPRPTPTPTPRPTPSPSPTPTPRPTPTPTPTPVATPPVFTNVTVPTEAQVGSRVTISGTILASNGLDHLLLRISNDQDPSFEQHYLPQDIGCDPGSISCSARGTVTLPTRLQPGRYLVRLVATDRQGLSSTFAQAIEILP